MRTSTREDGGAFVRCGAMEHRRLPDTVLKKQCLNTPVHDALISRAEDLPLAAGSGALM